MRYVIRLAAALALLLLMALPALAQGRFVCEDDGSGELDCAALERAARALLSRDAEVALYFVEGGGEQDFQRRLEEAGLARGDGSLRARLLAVYVSRDPNFAQIIGGDEWNPALTVEVGGTPNIEIIHSQTLVPALTRASQNNGSFTDAYAQTLEAVEAAIADPPSPGGAINVNLWPLVAGAAGIGGAALGIGALSKRRAAARALAQAREQYTGARQAAGAAIAQLGQRLKDAAEKARYDQLSYSAADAQQLGAAQQQITQRFEQAQLTFDDAGERFERKARPTPQHYAAAGADYEQVRQLVAGLGEELGQLEARRQELDRLAQQAPGEIDRAKKA
jgi:hypothetical protein